MAGGGTSGLASTSELAAASRDGSFGVSEGEDDEAEVEVEDEDDEEAGEDEAEEEEEDGVSEGFDCVSTGGVGGISGPPGDGVS